MNRTFKGTVVAINPTDTSNLRGGCVAVSVRVDAAEMGQLSFTLTMNLPADDARAMGALVGLPNAVSVSVSAGETRGDPLPDVGHYFTAGAQLCRHEEEGATVVADVYAALGGKVTGVEHAARLAYALNSANDDTVRWIVTDGNDPTDCANGEFGVEVNGKAYIYYKWPIAYTSDVGYRQIHEREFGETIRVERNSGSSQSDAISAAVDLLRRAQVRLVSESDSELLAREIRTYIARVAGPRVDDECEEDAGS